MESREISVVIQGPVAASSERAMGEGAIERCIQSVRDLLPDAKIILSTWQGSDVEGLDVDDCVMSEDPGGFSYSCPNTKVVRYLNVNRQIVSTLAGLKRVTTPYAMKLRSDNYLTHTAFIDFFERYQERCDDCCLLEKRVVASTWFSRNPHTFLPFPFHPSDLFQFGCSKDLLAIWDLPLADQEMAYYFAKELQERYYMYFFTYQFAPEQYLWIEFLKKQGIDVPCQHYYDHNPKALSLSELSIANNLLLAPPKMLGFCSPKHRINMSNDDTAATVYTHEEWLALYRRYCAAHIEIPGEAFSHRVTCLRRFKGFLLFRAKRLVMRFFPWFVRWYVNQVHNKRT